MQIQKPCNKQISRKIEKLENTKIFFIIEESKATILDFTQKKHESIANEFCKFVLVLV